MHTNLSNLSKGCLKIKKRKDKKVVQIYDHATQHMDQQSKNMNSLKKIALNTNPCVQLVKKEAT